jgi:hypothetical protein
MQLNLSGLSVIQNFTVVHWRRGDQLMQRCRHGFDRSINCKNESSACTMWLIITQNTLHQSPRWQGNVAYTHSRRERIFWKISVTNRRMRMYILQPTNRNGLPKWWCYERQVIRRLWTHRCHRGKICPCQTSWFWRFISCWTLQRL